MDEYHPRSEFLCALIREDIPLTGSPMGEANLARLIELTADAHDSNRDWATMLLVQSGIDTPAVRTALKRAADDPHVDTRCEALLGVAVFDPGFALPRVRALLEGDDLPRLALEAAGLLADRSLLPLLEAWAAILADDDDQWFGATLAEALQACRSAPPPAG